MTTISIDSNIYKGVESYARQNNISIRELAENSLRKFIVSEKKNVKDNGAKNSLFRNC